MPSFKGKQRVSHSTEASFTQQYPTVPRRKKLSPPGEDAYGGGGGAPLTWAVQSGRLLQPCYFVHVRVSVLLALGLNYHVHLPTHCELFLVQLVLFIFIPPAFGEEKREVHNFLLTLQTRQGTSDGHTESY